MVELFMLGIACFIGLKFFSWAVDVISDFVSGSAKFIAFAFIGAVFWSALTGTEVVGTVQMMFDNVINIVNQ